MKLDEELADTLRPWFEIPAEYPLPEFPRDITNLLVDRAQVDVSVLESFVTGLANLGPAGDCQK